MNEDLIFIDIETTGLNPYNEIDDVLDEKKYKIGENRTSVLTIQIMKNDDIGILKLWEYNSEKDMIDDFIAKIMNFIKDRRIKEGYNKDNYLPLFRYGEFDIPYLIGRCSFLFSKFEMKIIHYWFINSVKHINLMQYDSDGKMLTLEKVCERRGIIRNSKYFGRDVPRLFYNEQYNDIVVHGVDDINALYELVCKYGIYGDCYRR